MARVLWLGDAGCHTGFARVTHSIGDRLVRDHGHEVSVLAVNYEGDYWPTPMRLYRPNKLSPMDVYGQTRILEMLAEIEPEIVVILNDPIPILKFLFENKNDPQRTLLSGRFQFPDGRVLDTHHALITYMPIDGHSYPPVTDILGKVSTRVAMSKFGQAQMADSRLVYHGVDSETFRPVSISSPMISSSGAVVTSKREAKQAFGYDPDGFLVLRVDRNSHRKDYPATWKALVPVMKRHTDIHAHFHCLAIGDQFNLRELVSREAEVAKRIHFPDGITSFRGWSEQDMAILYNAADVFVSTSWGEGFGLTVAEALASGVPVIAQNVSATTEVVGPGGVLIDPVREMSTPMGHEQWLPDIEAFSQAIEHLYLSRGARRKLGAAGRQHVAATYSWDESARGMNSLIHELIDQRSSGGPQTGSEPGTDPGGEVQHRDEGPDREGGRGRGSPTDPALHGVLNG